MATACKHPTDWCHICGERPEQLADIWYPRFAEQGTGPNHYIRICANCANCADVIAQVARGQLETAPGSTCHEWGIPLRGRRRARRR